MTRRVVRYAREAPIEKWVVDRAFEIGVISLKLGHRYDTSWPDRLFFIPGGRPKLIEFKRPGDDPDPKQEDKHETLRALGYQVEVHDDRDAALLSIRRAVEMGTKRRSAPGGKVPPGARGGGGLRRSGRG